MNMNRPSSSVRETNQEPLSKGSTSMKQPSESIAIAAPSSAAPLPRSILSSAVKKRGRQRKSLAGAGDDRTSKIRREVTFSSKMRVLPCRSRCSLTPEEVALLWRSTREGEATKADTFRALAMARRVIRRGQEEGKSLLAEDEATAVRGLEHMLSAGSSRTRRRRRERIVSAVMAAQRETESSSVGTEERVAAASRSISKASSERAGRLAAMDAAAARGRLLKFVGHRHHRGHHEAGPPLTASKTDVSPSEARDDQQGGDGGNNDEWIGSTIVLRRDGEPAGAALLDLKSKDASPPTAAIVPRSPRPASRQKRRPTFHNVKDLALEVQEQRREDRAASGTRKTKREGAAA